MTTVIAQQTHKRRIGKGRKKSLNFRDIDDFYDELACKWAARAEKLKKYKRNTVRMRMRGLQTQ